MIPDILLIWLFMLRELTITDLPQVLAIEQATQKAPWSEDVFTRCLEMGYKGWVLAESDQITGFLLMSFVLGECHILNLCVHPDYQRKGLGRELLQHALLQAKQKGAGIAYLEVRRSNKRAIALYNQAGFVQISERKNYYPDPKVREDALVFAKDLGVD